MFYMFFLLETSIAILFDQRVTVWPWVPLGSTSAKMIPTFHRFSGIAMILFPYQIQWKKYCSQIVSFPQVLTGKKYLKH